MIYLTSLYWKLCKMTFQTYIQKNVLKPILKGPNNLGQLSRRLPSVGVGVSPLVLLFNLKLADCHCCIDVFCLVELV